MSIKNPTGRLARWSLLIQQFDFDIKCRSGKSNADADALSRRPYNIFALDFPGLQSEKIKEHQHHDIDLSIVLQYLKTKDLSEDDKKAIALLLVIEEYYLSHDGLLFYLWSPTTNRRNYMVQNMH